MSSAKTRSKRSGRILLVLVMVLGLAFSALPVLGQDGLEAIPADVAADIAAEKVEALYIVMMVEDPAIAYEGDIKGLKATKPAKGKKYNPNSRAARDYEAYLLDGQADALATVDGDAVYNYTVSFNGFAAVLTGAEAAALEASSDVAYVWANEIRKPTTDLSPDYLGMTDVWRDGSGHSGLQGDGIIVGVIDTGIWPENPSFSDVTDGVNLPGNGNHTGLVEYSPPPASWLGVCEEGEDFTADLCNNKLIGARYFVDGFGIPNLFDGEYVSPRDWDGHGSHTASTAAGNQWDSDFGTIVGMAPRAYVAMYKACWNSDDGGCATADLVGAIDQAVADGVDVINYSIGSSAQSVSGPDDVAFLFAEDSGVFVATSNGNSGPARDTTGSPSSSPWVTSVGATNHRGWIGEVTLGSGDFYPGASLADPAGTGPMPVVDAADHGNPLCYPSIAFVPPITDNAVLCWRGDIARVDKSLAVYEQGGIGMILANVSSTQGTNADVHSVPSIHVNFADGGAIATYVATATDPTIDIAGQLGGVGAVAGFSSRGIGFSSDLIKPDIGAPGAAVLAADAEDTYYGINTSGVGYKSGTSMASPHIAGIGALMVEAHPDWTPTMIKSALMTTADPFATFGDDGVAPATPFDTGSGLVQPFAALDPGLVYNAGLFEYAAWTCGVGAGIFTPGTCVFLEDIGIPMDPSDLNQPSIAIGELAGSQTVTRIVTNVGDTATYSVAFDAPPGVDVTVSPSSMKVKKGKSAAYTVTFEVNDSGVLDEYAFGSLTWSDGTHDVSSQIAVRPVQIAFPASVHGSGTEGSVSFDISFGYTGDYTAGLLGLVPAGTEDGTVGDDPANDINAALGTCDWSSFPYVCTGLTWHLVEVPAGSEYVRFSLLDAYTDGADDLDMYVWGPSGGFFGSSGSGTSAEQVSGLLPDAGFYEVAVHGWQTEGPDSNYTLFSWAFTGDEGNATLTAPGAALLGNTDAVTVNWSGLTAGQMYLGAVTHSDAGPLGMTFVEIDS